MLMDTQEARDEIIIGGICRGELEAAIEAQVRANAEPVIKAVAADLATRLRTRITTMRDHMTMDGVRVMVQVEGVKVADTGDKA